MGVGMLSGDTDRRATVRITPMLSGCGHVAVEDRTRTIILKDRITIQWRVKPGSFAVLSLADGTTFYLVKELICREEMPNKLEATRKTARLTRDVLHHMR